MRIENSPVGPKAAANCLKLAVSDPPLLAAVKRIPLYILKLVMVYAANEGTLSDITRDQLDAVILVGRYGEILR